MIIDTHISTKPCLGRVLLGHGAGAPMDSEFMQWLAERFVALGFEVVRYEFPYMQKRREDGKRRPPDRLPVLQDFLQQLIRQFDDGVPLYLAGKSMGGRIASMLLEDKAVQAAFVFGYPFHPAGKPDKLRTEHLMTLTKPLHIFQGSRDTMGSLQEVAGYNLPDIVSVHWLDDGNHDLKPRKASGFTQQQHLDLAFQIIEESLN